MKYLILLLFAILFLLITCLIIIIIKNYIRISANKLEITSKLKEKGFSKVYLQPYDYKLEKNDRTYLVKVVMNKKTSELTINSKTDIYFNKKVKAKEVKQLIKFMNYNTPKNCKKICVIYPYSKVMIKAINKAEYEFVKTYTDCFGTHFINYNKLKYSIDTLI